MNGEPEAFDRNGRPVAIGAFMADAESGAFVGRVALLSLSSETVPRPLCAVATSTGTLWMLPAGLIVLDPADPAYPPVSELGESYDSDDGVEDLIRVARETAEEILRNEYPVSYRNLIEAIERVELNR